ncbi:hypothetical protein [Streptomyces bangladeshensis]|uniref:Uncharacterized protein n=1 Tax=Streptomyces bangladeshensis TaxID=295352 RepID=A0ABN3BBW4_9ACTN
MSVATPAPIVSPDHLLDAPLDDLLTETGVEIVDSTITDADFFGAVVQHKSGRLLLAMPTGRSELEHDTVARYLLAQVFHVDLPKLPAPFETTEL